MPGKFFELQNCIWFVPYMDDDKSALSEHFTNWKNGYWHFWNHFYWQVGVGFNRDKWEHLERYVRKLTKLYKNVYVCTGPLYLPKRDADGKSYVK